MAGAEHHEQLMVARYLDLTGWLWCHPPNGGVRSKWEGSRLKKEGVKRGVPDVLIFEPVRLDGHHYHGIAIELKAQKGRPSKDQVAWLDALSRKGWLARVCYGAQEAISLVAQCVRVSVI